MPESLVNLSGVTRNFETRGGPVAAVSTVSCKVNSCERIAIMGPSGSGKSTLMALMADLDQPTEGVVTWPSLTAGMSLRPGFIGLAFQTPSLIPALTAVENVELPLLVMGKTDSPREKAIAVLDFLDLAHLADRLPEELSGGQAQRIALARAMVSEPRLILADEPTGQLDQATGRSVMQKLLDWALRTNAALVVATHDQALARQMQETWHIFYGKLEIAHTLRAVS